MTLPAKVAAWDPAWREWHEEKSAIIEADLGCSRAEADARAERLARIAHGDLVPGPGPTIPPRGGPAPTTPERRRGRPPGSPP